MRTLVNSILAVTTLVSAGFKKKQPTGAPAAKTAEGSAAAPAVGSAAPAATTPTPAAAATPGELRSVLNAARAAGTLTTFVKAVDAAGLTEKRFGAGPFTVFAPTDAAFATLPPKDLEAPLVDKAQLQALLESHIVEGNIASKDLSARKTVKTAQGSELAIDASNGIKIGGAAVVTPDLSGANGVIHAIDTVLAVPN